MLLHAAANVLVAGQPVSARLKGHATRAGCRTQRSTQVLAACVQVDQAALAGRGKNRGSVGKENALDSPPLASLSLSGKLSRGSVSGRSASLRRPLAPTTANILESAPVTPAPLTPSLALDMDKEAQMAAMVCSIDNKDACLACGS